jgi:hypothetical protein
MMWLNSKLSGGHRSSMLKQILFFAFILCFLVAFSLSFAGDDGGQPEDGEHPWDDLCNTDWNRTYSDTTETDEFLTFPFGCGSGFIFHMQSPVQDGGWEQGKVFGPAQKNRGYLFIFIK